MFFIHSDNEKLNIKKPPSEIDILVKQASKGDSYAFGELVKKYEKMVYNLAYQYSGNREDAYDISQEVFIKAWRAIASFRGDCSFSTWLYRITKNAYLDYSMKLSRRETVSLGVTDEDGEDKEIEIVSTDETTSPEKVAEKNERAAALHLAISSLGDEHREIIVLREFEGYSYEDIAEMLSLELGTVKSRINRARKQIKNFLEERNFF
ncbi:MAG: sigma-70 family RNA polymerase sigma factor [Clostridia bacterium]|nr:sigma-70 family RNA polymerase sigma factor [Clostridia bacterium]